MSLAQIPSNYAVYLFLVVLFLSIMLLPLVVPLGRLLPLGYALIDKNRDDYGKLCGRVYFCNTLGTVAGAVGIGYVLFLVMSLPLLFKLNMALLLLVAAALGARGTRRWPAVACLAAAASAFLLPGWNRTSHVVAAYRDGTVQPHHFQGLFRLPWAGEAFQVHLLRDDPGATIAAYAAVEPDPIMAGAAVSKTLAVNGKSDGNTIGDYSNMVLSAMLPYLYAPREAALEAAVVGLGTGMTSGALAAMPDVVSVTTLEISPGVIEAARFFDEGNFGLSGAPASRIVLTDAFRYFARSTRTFDMIASEPSNPWVAGVENLFTPEFYALVSRALGESGVLFQWIQLYATTEEIFSAICFNVSHAFPHVLLFRIGKNDVGILASHAELAGPHLERRMEQPAAQRALRPIRLDGPGLLPLLQLLETPQLRALASSSGAVRHGVEFPWIGPAACRAAFTAEAFELPGQALTNVGRHLPWSAPRRAAFAEWMGRHATSLQPWCEPVTGLHSAEFLCARLQSLAADYRNVHEPAGPVPTAAMLESYGRLRHEGYVAADLHLLETAKDALLAQGSAPRDPARHRAAGELVKQLALEWEWERAERAAAEFGAAGIIAQRDLDTARRQIGVFREIAAAWRE